MTTAEFPEGTEPPGDAVARIDPEVLALGRQIRRLRTERQLTVEQLAQRAGVSRSLVSQVERGRALPSLGTLRHIAGALSVAVGNLFIETVTSVPGERDRFGQQLVVRADTRKRLQVPDSGISYELLVPDCNRRIEMLWAVVPPHATTGREYSAHEGEECLVLIEGELVVIYEDTEFTLTAGDSMSFDCTRPHRMVNQTGTPAVFVVAVSPASF